MNIRRNHSAGLREPQAIAETGDGGAAAVIASALIVALALVSFFYYFGLGGVASNTIEVTPPTAAVSVAPEGQ
jgi:hypothetical protein